MLKPALPLIVLAMIAIGACSEKTEQAAGNTLESAKDDIATRAAPVASEAAAKVGDAVGDAATDAAAAIDSAAKDIDSRVSRDDPTPAPNTRPTGTPSPQ